MELKRIYLHRGQADPTGREILTTGAGARYYLTEPRGPRTTVTGRTAVEYRPPLQNIPVQEPAPEAGDAVSMVNASAWGRTCPFRGQRPIAVVTVMLDERCPAAVPSYMVPVDARYKGVGEVEGQPIPIMRADSYCSTCLEDRVREVELGITFKKMEPGSGGERRGVGRRRSGKGAVARMTKMLVDDRK